MTALLYLLAFLSGAAAACAICIIIAARKRKCESDDEIGRGFMNILNY